MRTFPTFLCLVLMALSDAPANGATEFPYPWEVPVGGATVRSGPGRTYYPTDRIEAGMEVQVYRHAPGGWLGIRPPSGSHSWVRQKDLEDTGQPGVARVAHDGVVCYIGSSVAEIQEHVVQVHLERDERVRLLPMEDLGTESARQLESQGWRRIAPPAGEFRWIPRNSAAVRHSAIPADRAVEGRMIAHQESVEGTGNRSLEPAPRIPTEAGSPVPSEENRPVGPAPESIDDGWIARSHAGVDDLLEVERRLAAMASREVGSWRLRPLRARVESELERQRGPARARAERLLERIEEFERLQHQHAAVGDAAPSHDAERPDASATVSASEAAERLRQRFDGSGWLVPVHSARRVAPPYALLDAEGEVLMFVSPAPGLNLHRYLRQEVGLHGQRSHPDSLNQPHLTAERIVELRRHLR